MTITGTHDSITGERGRGLLSWLVTPFARTQRLGITEQLAAGVRFFDLRVRKCGDGVWRGAHGLWTSEKSIEDVLFELESAGECTWVEITLERGNRHEGEFLELVERLRECSRHVCIRAANVKLPKWRSVRHWDSEGCPWEVFHTFVTLDGRSWHTWLPVPWLWHKVYGAKAAKAGCVNTYDFWS